MKRNIYIIAVAIVQVLAVSCGNSDKEIAKIVEERDSLRSVNAINALQLENHGRLMDVINSTFDSIAYQEDVIFIKKEGETPISKEEVKYNILQFESLLKRQKERISQLERQLAEKQQEQKSADTDDLPKSLKLLSHLREQIDAKDKQIAQLKQELDKKNVDMARLQTRFNSQRTTIDSQNATINELNNRSKKQREALARQDAMLNNGYVLIGAKDDLKRKGIITKKGKLVSEAVWDRAKFAKVDIRTWTEISFTAKRPRILTHMPASSYELTTTGSGNFTLKVKNPSEFWRISNYLVIQTN